LFYRTEQRPEDQRKVALDAILKSSKPETWHWKLIILFLVLIILGLLGALFFSSFDVKFAVSLRNR
jgi:hypothetical protein